MEPRPAARRTPERADETISEKIMNKEVARQWATSLLVPRQSPWLAARNAVKPGEGLSRRSCNPKRNVRAGLPSNPFLLETSV